MGEVLQFNNSRTGFLAHVKHALGLMFQPGEVFEIRAIEVPRSNGYTQTWAGFFDSIDRAADEAIRIDDLRPLGIYFTPNPVKPDLLARAANRMKPVTNGRKDFTAKDVDISARHWLLVDCDPTRPAGISANNEEKAAAISKAAEIKEYLAAQSWPDPIEADSGNGAHLLYRVDLANDPAALDLVGESLRALHERFTTPAVTVDTTVKNAARIWKLYGTVARKGDSTPDRPWRRSKVTGSPAAIATVTLEQLEHLAGQAMPSVTPTADHRPLQRQHRGADLISRARAYLEATPPAVAGEHGDQATFRAAAALVVDFGLSETEALPLLEEWNARCSPPWSAADLCAKLRSAAANGKHERGRLADAPPLAAVRPADRQQERQAERRGRPNEADQVLAVALEEADIWKAEGQVWATIPAGGVMMNMPVRSSCFRSWIQTIYLREIDKAVGDEAAKKVSSNIEALAMFGGDGRPPARESKVFTRVGHKDGAVYFDLGDDQWRVVEITAEGWRVLTNSPVKFRRSPGMEALPTPESGGSLDALRPLINATADDNWILAVSWLVGAMHPTGPYPALILQGEQGTAKSTTARLLRDLIDPNLASLRTTPRDPRDIVIAASNGHVLSYDNLSGMPDWLSDLFCRIATGAGISNRRLYTDDEEAIIYVRKPIVLNGIDDVTNRGDMRDRGVILNLDRIPEEARIEEAVIMAEFLRLRPAILGALFSAVSMALKNQGKTKVNLPRMADFAAWVVAAEEALPWPRGLFLETFKEMNQTAVQTALEGSPLAEAVRKFVDDRVYWVGRATDLLGELTARVERAVSEGKFWPRDGQWLSRRLKRMAPELLKVGVDCKQTRTRSGGSVSLKKITAHAEGDAISAGDATKSDSVTDSVIHQTQARSVSTANGDAVTLFSSLSLSEKEKDNNKEGIAKIASLASLASPSATGAVFHGDATGDATGDAIDLPPCDVIPRGEP